MISSLVLAVLAAAVSAQDAPICVLADQARAKGCCVMEFGSTYTLKQLAPPKSDLESKIKSCNPQVGDGIFPATMIGFMPCNVNDPKGTTFTDGFGTNRADIVNICTAPPLAS